MLDVFFACLKAPTLDLSRQTDQQAQFTSVATNNCIFWDSKRPRSLSGEPQSERHVLHLLLPDQCNNMVGGSRSWERTKWTSWSMLNSILSTQSGCGVLTSSKRTNYKTKLMAGLIVPHVGLRPELCSEKHCYRHIMRLSQRWLCWSLNTDVLHLQVFAAGWAVDVRLFDE